MADPSSYVTNIPRTANPDVCPPGQSEYTLLELNDVFPSGVVSDTIAVDPTTNRIPQVALRQHFNTLVASGRIHGRQVDRTGNNEVNMDSQIIKDNELYTRLQNEYCFYEQRYKYALKQFLSLATSRNSADNQQANEILTVTITLNRRLNFMIEFMNFIAMDRVEETNLNVSSINTLNADIMSKLESLRITYEKIKTTGAVNETQKEMIRYTKEKNYNVTNQISVWTALNVLAIATVFYIYRSS